jgi:hypothetical protein
MKRMRLFAIIVSTGLLVTAGSDAGAVTPAEIAGKRLELTLVSDRIIRVNGNTKPQRAVQTTNISFSADQSFSGRYIHTVTNEVNGRMTTQSRTFNFNGQLGKPFAYRDGQAVWLLEGGSLVRLRTQEEGGTKLVVNFRRDGGSLKCTINRGYAREDGVGKLVSSSSMSGTNVEMLESKPVSSSCRVIE